MPNDNPQTTKEIILISEIAAYRESLRMIAAIQHGMPRDDHGAGSYYQAKLSMAQDLAEKTLEMGKVYS